MCQDPGVHMLFTPQILPCGSSPRPWLHGDTRARQWAGPEEKMGSHQLCCRRTLCADPHLRDTLSGLTLFLQTVRQSHVLFSAVCYQQDWEHQRAEVATCKWKASSKPPRHFKLTLGPLHRGKVGLSFVPNTLQVSGFLLHYPEVLFLLSLPEMHRSASEILSSSLCRVIGLSSSQDLHLKHLLIHFYGIAVT